MKKNYNTKISVKNTTNFVLSTFLIWRLFFDRAFDPEHKIEIDRAPFKYHETSQKSTLILLLNIFEYLIFEISPNICCLFSYLAIYLQLILFIQINLKQGYPMFDLCFFSYTHWIYGKYLKRKWTSSILMLILNWIPFNCFRNIETKRFLLKKLYITKLAYLFSHYLTTLIWWFSSGFNFVVFLYESVWNGYVLSF